MPPSQLKRLKASLRAEGIVGPQKSKKQKRNGKSDGNNQEQRIKRSVALAGIREAFNPFEVQPASGGKPKFDVTTNRTMGGRVMKGSKARPGVTKGLGEEIRRKTLLTEMHRRNKVGGIMDRRFGEDDPTMTPDEKILERFTKEKQRGFKKASMYDLEDDEEEETLTHFGRSLSFDQSMAIDDFDENQQGLLSDEDESSGMISKQRGPSVGDEQWNEGDEQDEDRIDPDRKKTKAEVMKEVIAKSKLHKYERQQTKDEDEDERDRIDKELPELLALMRGGRQSLPFTPETKMNGPSGTISSMNPERAAMLSKHDGVNLDKEYDIRLKQLAMDKRSQPTDRTMTEEERVEKEAARLRELEQRRLRRMRGEAEGSEDEADVHQTNGSNGDSEAEEDDATTFGLGAGLSVTGTKKRVLDVEDEDDFVLDRDLIASASEIEDSELSDGSEDDIDIHQAEADEDEDDEEFIERLSGEVGNQANESSSQPTAINATGANAMATSRLDLKLSYTYPCPQSHDELLNITRTISHDALPTVIQRIRALYHPKLAAENKAKLGQFAAVLVDHLSYLANQEDHPPFTVLETLVRHIHSLAKTHPDEVGKAFRSHLQELHQSRPLAPTPGDLIILTAIGTVFPTSDHFHPIVTPAILSMTRYLGLHSPATLSDLATSTYMATLCLQYQRESKRYIPEVINHVLSTLCILAPTPPDLLSTVIPVLDVPTSLRIQNSNKSEFLRSLNFWDILPLSKRPNLALSLLSSQLSLLDHLIFLYTTKPCFPEIFSPFLRIIIHLLTPPCLIHLPLSSHLTRTLTHLRVSLSAHLTSRLPLALHHHRPLAIKTSIPKFEESFNPDKHYDPDRERSESNKLRAEHRREKKGAVRELRKDANFIAREQLREKKERDAEYEKKYRRLVAEIQGEEGKDGKDYEREKRLRQSARKSGKRN